MCLRPRSPRRTRLFASLCALTLLLLASLAGCAAVATGADPVPAERPTGQLEVVAQLDGPSPAGVAVSRGGRIFVSFPRWDRGVEPTVGEWVDGRVVPYPSAELNELDTQAPAEHLLSVENVTIGPDNDLWLLDTGRPGFEITVERGAKLVRVDLETDEVLDTHVLPAELARDDSYLAGLAVDAGHAYLTDASPSGTNGLAVVDLETGEAWRTLDLHPSTRAAREFVPIVEGRPMFFHPEGWRRDYMSLGANGIAVDSKAGRVYYAPTASRQIYSLDRQALSDPQRRPDRLAATILRHGDGNFASDGMAIDARGTLYLGNYEHNAVMRIGPNGGHALTLVHDPRLLWPDGLAIRDGWLYILTNQRHRGGVFNQGEDLRQPPYLLFRTRLSTTDSD